MIDVFSTEYQMFQNQLEIEKEAKQAWKWMNLKGNVKKKRVDNRYAAKPIVACCQPACC